MYGATKFAVSGFHAAWRTELGPDRIRVCLIEPGSVWTEFGPNLGDALHRRGERIDALTSHRVAHAPVYAFAQSANLLLEKILIRPVLQVAPQQVQQRCAVLPFHIH